MRDDRTTIHMDGDGYFVEPNGDERLLAMLIYALSYFTVIIAPLLIWLLKRDDSYFIDFHGKNYFNFILSYFIYGVIASISTLLLVGFVLLPIVGFFQVLFTIVGAIKAYQGEKYRIPLTITFIK